MSHFAHFLHRALAASRANSTAEPSVAFCDGELADFREFVVSQVLGRLQTPKSALGSLLSYVLGIHDNLLFSLPIDCWASEQRSEGFSVFSVKGSHADGKTCPVNCRRQVLLAMLTVLTQSEPELLFSV